MLQLAFIPSDLYTARLDVTSVALDLSVVKAGASFNATFNDPNLTDSGVVRLNLDIRDTGNHSWRPHGHEQTIWPGLAIEKHVGTADMCRYSTLDCQAGSQAE